MHENSQKAWQNIQYSTNISYLFQEIKEACKVMLEQELQTELIE